MTGPLVLPADPVSANQAADKHYVDVSVASVSSGGGGKVLLAPSGTQVVTQPAGTDLETNRLNGTEYASQYATIPNTNGVESAATSTDCASAGAAGVGCLVVVEPTVNGTETYTSKAGWGDQTHIQDMRRGSQHDIYLNPKSTLTPGDEVGQAIDMTTTYSIQADNQAGGREEIQATGESISLTGLTGGSNLFSAELGSVPYFKSGYTALGLSGTYNTAGQHILATGQTNCYAVGDCLIGSQFLYSMGGYRDNADEGTHPYDIQVVEDPRVFQGACSTGCTTGSQSLVVGSQTNGGTQGDGRYLIDTNPAKVLTAGTLTGGSVGTIHPTATFTGTSFAVSTFFQTATLVPSQAHNIAPGTVTVAIATSGLPAGFSANTAAAPASSGVACLAAQSSALPNHEMVPYTVVDGTHVQMTMQKPHGAGTTIAIGGLCGYGLEQTVDTLNGIRQAFPVIGSYSATGLYYAGASTAIVGQMGTTAAYANVSLPIVSAARSGNVVTVTFSGALTNDLNGLTMTVAGVTDSSYNGSFPVTTTSATTLTYPETGPNSTTTGGTISYVTGGYALYPMAEVLGVYNAATKTVDGTFTLAPNTVAWAAGDTVEEPHYFQQKTGGDTTYIRQTVPRPQSYQSPGYYYGTNNGPGLRGFQIQNVVPASSYFGNGGTHGYPDIAYMASGIWNRTFDGQAGEQSVFSIHCNSKGCNRWNSGYDLFEMDSSAGVDVENYAPQTSTLSMTLRGTGYSFSPLAFTAGTANITTLNATTVSLGVTATTSLTTGALTASSISSTGALTATSETLSGTSTSAAITTGTVTATTLKGALDAANISSGTLDAARLPVMGASGSAHAFGVVPDPGATAGITRYLREDGTWVAPGGGVTSYNGRSGAISPANGDYSFSQLSGSVVGAQMPAFSGDCSIAAGTTTITCTHANGKAFASSAVVDTTNASNIASGTLPEARMPALKGDVSTSGSGTKVTVTAINGRTLSTSGRLQKTNASGQLVDAIPGVDYVVPTSPAVTALLDVGKLGAGVVAGTFAAARFGIGAVKSTTGSPSTKSTIEPHTEKTTDDKFETSPKEQRPKTEADRTLLADYDFLQGSGDVLKDLSGHSNNGNFGAASPVWTNVGLKFEPGQGIRLPDAIADGQTFVVAVYLNPLKTGKLLRNDLPSIITSSLGSDGLNLLTAYDLDGKTYSESGAQALSILVNGAHRTSSAKLISGFHVFGYVVSKETGKPDHLYVDGVETDTYLAQGVPLGNTVAGKLYLGSNGHEESAHSGLDGVAYRLRIYSSELGPTEILALTRTIVREVAERGEPTAPHPVQLSKPQIHVIGDEISAGTNDTSAWPAALDFTQRSDYNLTNWSIEDVPAQALNGTEQNRAALRCTSDSGSSLALVFAGSDDLAKLPGMTPARVFGNLIGEVQTLKRAGCTVFVGTMLSRKGNDLTGKALDQDKNALNALIVNRARNVGADGVIDFAANPLLGKDGASIDTRYFSPDGIRPTQEGQNLLADAANHAIDYYFGSIGVGSVKIRTLPYVMKTSDVRINLDGLIASGIVTLPNCIGQSGAAYQIDNPQSVYEVLLKGADKQPIENTKDPIPVPSDGSITLRDIPNSDGGGGCHWAR